MDEMELKISVLAPMIYLFQGFLEEDPLQWEDPLFGLP